MLPRNPPCPASGTMTRTGCTASPAESARSARSTAGMSARISRNLRTAASSRINTAAALISPFHELVVDELIGVRGDRHCATERPVESNDDKEHHGYEARQACDENPLETCVLDVGVDAQPRQ